MTRVSKAEQTDESYDSLSEQQKDAVMDSSKSERVDGESDGSLGDAKSDVNPEEVDNFLGDAATPVIQDSVEYKGATSVNEEKEKGKVSKSSTMVTSEKRPSKHDVFINFRRTDLHEGFVDHLVEALKKVGLSVCIDEDELLPGDLTELLFKRIEESRIAIVIFSSSYTESTWCLDKLVKIKECMDEGKLLIVPIFYKVKQLQVEQLEGNFGVRLWNLWRIHRDHRIIKCKEALEHVGGMRGFPFEEQR